MTTNIATSPSSPQLRLVKVSALACFALAVGLLISSLSGANGAVAQSPFEPHDLQSLALTAK